MAERPVFVPLEQGPRYVQVTDFEFKWHPGFAPIQKTRCIQSLHEAAAVRALSPLLEVSSRSPQPLGVSLSAFNLSTQFLPGRTNSVETAYQAGKAFEQGGPYVDLLDKEPGAARTDERLKTSGALTGFRLGDDEWGLNPPTAFYDWLYLTALCAHPELAEQLSAYRGFTDIFFNPDKGVNCQAHSAALYVSFHKRGLLGRAMRSKEAFLALLSA